MFTNPKAEKLVIENILDYQDKRGTPDVRLFSAAGMTRPTWKGRLRGETSFTVRELIAVSEVLGVSLQDLTEGTKVTTQERAA